MHIVILFYTIDSRETKMWDIYILLSLVSLDYWQNDKI